MADEYQLAGIAFVEVDGNGNRVLRAIDEATIDSVEAVATFTDPAGVDHTGEIADLADLPGFSVSDDGTLVVDNPSDVDFGSNLTVTDNGDGTVTVGLSDSPSVTDLTATNSITDPAGVKHTGELADIEDIGTEGGSSLVFEQSTSLSNTTQVENMTWETASRQLDFLPDLEAENPQQSIVHNHTRFDNDLFGATSNYFKRIPAPTTIAPTIDGGTMTVNNSSGSDAGELFAPWTKLQAPAATIAVKVDDVSATAGTNTTFIKTGVALDGDNRISAQVSYGNDRIELFTQFAGSGSSTTLSSASVPTEPYWLVMFLTGNFGRVLTYSETDGWTHHGVESWSGVDLNLESSLNDWYPQFGYFIPDGESVTFSDFKILNSSRFGVLSPMPVHYKDGAPFIQDGELYLTAAIGGDSLDELPMGVYAMDTETYDLRLTGVIFNRPEGNQDHIIQDQGFNLVYDDDTDEWIVTATGFASSSIFNKTQEIYVTRTTDDPRFGVKSYKMSAMNLPNTNNHGDHWLIYDDAASAWRCYYMGQRDPRTSILAETTDDSLTSGWTQLNSRSVASGEMLEGNQISRVAGEYIVSNTDSEQVNGYATADYPDVSANVQSPTVDQASGFKDPHFRVISIPSDGETKYIALSMGGERSFGLGQWSAGSMIVYEADQRATGYEYPRREFLG